MNVIRHHHPSLRPVALTVEIQQGGFNQLRRLRIAEMARAMAFVQVGFDLCQPVEVILNGEEGGPCGPTGDGHGVGQSKGEELIKASAVKGREVAA